MEECKEEKEDKKLEQEEELQAEDGVDLANCPAVFLSYFSLWICYEIQPAVGTPYTAVQNVWTIYLARNDQFESSFWLKRLAIYM